MRALAEARSLLQFVEAPVVVAEPDGKAIYLNPAFEASFEVSAQRALGRPLAELFEGGNREAVLNAVAKCVTRGQSVRFRVRERVLGFQAQCSPIVLEGERVGCILLLTEASVEAEDLMSVRRELQEAVSALGGQFEKLAQESLADPDVCADWVRSAEPSLRQLRRVLQKIDSLCEPADPGGPPCFDPGRLVRDAVGRVAADIAELGITLDVVVPQGLPMVRGDRAPLQEALESLLLARIVGEPPPNLVTLAARPDESQSGAGVLIQIGDAPWGEASEAGEPLALQRAVLASGGSIQTQLDADTGRTTIVRLPAVP